MKEIIILSGKGGTGKTSICGAFAAFAEKEAVLADCDVDATDLHLLLQPRIRSSNSFVCGHKSQIDQQVCTNCGYCQSICRFDAIHKNPKTLRNYYVNSFSCEGCGVCVHFCPVQAVKFEETISGEWFISDTRFGPMVHASLSIGAGNSGKLVTVVRKEAKKIAEANNANYLLVDGSPGVGCPVIASLTAADLALVVTEPTVSGEHDLHRISRLTKQLGIKTVVCINKWDINPEITQRITAYTQIEKIEFAGLIRYDKDITRAQRAGLTLPEFSSGEILNDIAQIWNYVK